MSRVLGVSRGVEGEGEGEGEGHGMMDRDGKCGMLLTVHVLHVR